MSNRPDRVKIGPLVYTIEWKGQDWEDTNRLLGQCVPSFQVIRLSERLQPDRMACVFIHEIYHALADHMQCFNKITPEQSASVAGDGMTMFWIDNPDAFDWYSGLIESSTTKRY